MIEESDLHSKESRFALAKMVMRLFDYWQIPVSEQAAMLNRSVSTIRRYRAGGCIGDDNELFDRVGHLLSIHESLRIIFPHNRDLVYDWISAKNKAYENLAPIDVMKKGVDGILKVRRYLEANLGR